MLFQPTVSKHWRHTTNNQQEKVHLPYSVKCSDEFWTTHLYLPEVSCPANIEQLQLHILHTQPKYSSVTVEMHQSNNVAGEHNMDNVDDVRHTDTESEWVS